MKIVNIIHYKQPYLKKNKYYYHFLCIYSYDRKTANDNNAIITKPVSIYIQQTAIKEYNNITSN